MRCHIAFLSIFVLASASAQTTLPNVEVTAPHFTAKHGGYLICAGPAASTFSTARRNPEPDGWQHFSTSFDSTETTQSARLTLSGECRSGGAGIAIHYFDDVSVVPDQILMADFEMQNF